MGGWLAAICGQPQANGFAVLGYRSSSAADLHPSAAAAFLDGPIGIDLPALLGCAVGRGGRTKRFLYPSCFRQPFCFGVGGGSRLRSILASGAVVVAHPIGSFGGRHSGGATDAPGGVGDFCLL